MVKDYVLSQIENNEMSQDDRIPSESEFAKLLDVSSITVRKALTDLVNEGVIYRVKGKGSFVAGMHAPAADKSSNLIAFVISGIEMYDSSYMQIMKGVQSFIAKHDFKLIIEFVENDVEEEHAAIMSLIESEVRGILIYSSNPDSAKTYLDAIRRNAIPFVMMDRFPSGHPVNCISCNNHDGAYEAVEYLIQLGHRGIGFAALDFHLSPEVDRYNGYRNAMLGAKLPLSEENVYLDKTIDYAQLAARINDGALTAIFCVNDRRAMEMVENLIAQGIRIPEQVSVMGFDDFESAKYAKVALSTVKQHFDVLGYESAKLLMEISSASTYGYKKILLPTSLVIRESTSAPGSSAQQASRSNA
nr:GntR family transcriptional regulator [Paenibacillus sacheonensis]